LLYQTVKAYILCRSNKKSEADLEIEQVLAEVKEKSINEKDLIDKLEVVLRDMDKYDGMIILLKSLHEKKPNDKEFAL
jgi:hypothetical protein